MKGKTRTSWPSLSLKVSVRVMMRGCESDVRILTSRPGLWGSTLWVSVITLSATVLQW